MNAQEVAKMVEDIEQLDNELFGDALKQPRTTYGRVSIDADTKKRVAFQDFEADLEELLESPPSEQEDSPKRSKNRNVKSSLIEDLFKIKDAGVRPGEKFEPVPKSEIMPSERQSNYSASNEFSAPSKSTSSRSETNSRKSEKRANGEDDGLINLQDGASVESTTKKSLLMQDLFHDTVPRKDTEEMPVSRATTQQVRTPSSTAGYTTSTTREPRRARRNSKFTNDPLGLLSDLISEPSAQPAPPARKTEIPRGNIGWSDLPEWLRDGKEADAETDKEKPIVVTGIAEKKGPETREELNAPEIPENAAGSAVPTERRDTIPSNPDHFSLLVGTGLGQQATFMSMQLREQELRTATVLSEQNEQLNKLLESQKARLADQEKQFNALIRMQLEKQCLLEEQMKMQQERIDQHIRALTAQSSPQLFTAMPDKQRSTDVTDDASKEKPETEHLVKNLRLEKSELEAMLHTLNEKHELEMAMREESYKRQINFLQETIENFDRKTRQELELLEADHRKKLETWREDRTRLENDRREEIEILKKSHAEEIEEIHERHLRNTKLLQEEHADSIKNVLSVKQAESRLMETIANRNADIEEVLQRTTLLIDNISAMQQEIETRNEETIKLRENRLKEWEDDVRSQRGELESRRNKLDVEREKIIGTAEKLDSRVMELIAELQKQIARYNDAEETLDKKSRCIMRERELLEEKTKWERDCLQTLKESWQKEQQRQIKALAEEREAVAMERAELEVVVKLKADAESIARIESQASIKAAEQAIKRANQERTKWEELTAQLEAERHLFHQKETMLVTRAKELDHLTRSALAKKEEGSRALKEAKLLEDRHRKELDRLQTQLGALIQREKKVAAEKLDLARKERALLLQRSEIETPERDIRIESGSVNNSPLEDLPPFRHYGETAPITEIIDPHLAMLKLELADRLNVTENYLDMMQG